MFNQQELLKGDWDILIVLDACRFDMFESVNFPPGLLVKADCKCTNTEQWYEKNWKGNYEDIILITANPHSRVTNTEKNFFRCDRIYLEKEWTNPEIAFKRMEMYSGQYERIIVHVIPPHLPFIGDCGKKFLDEIIDLYDSNQSIYRQVEDWGRKNGWEQLKFYYKESLQKTLDLLSPYIRKMKRHFTITSDHGELIGEKNKYDHNYAEPEIFEVPWLTCL